MESQWHQLTESEIAEFLDISVGTINEDDLVIARSSFRYEADYWHGVARAIISDPYVFSKISALTNKPPRVILSYCYGMYPDDTKMLDFMKEVDKQVKIESKKKKPDEVAFPDKTVITFEQLVSVLVDVVNEDEDIEVVNLVNSMKDPALAVCIVLTSKYKMLKSAHLLGVPFRKFMEVLGNRLSIKDPYLLIKKDLRAEMENGLFVGADEELVN